MSAKECELIQWAAREAEALLSPLGERWNHVQGVVQRAHSISQLFNQDERCYLIAAAYLHDIGYAPILQKTGFHPIDGAYYLKSCNQDRLASLVAYHSEAQFEAEQKGLLEQLEQFRREDSLVAKALTFCDMTTNSHGAPVSFEDRLEDIFQRYDQSHTVAKAIHQATPSLEMTVSSIKQKLEECRNDTAFVTATPTDIPECISLNRELFSVKDSASDEVLCKKWTSWIQKNPEVVYVLKRGEEVTGIITTLPFKPESAKFEKILRGDTSILLGDVDIQAEDIEEYSRGNHVQIYIAAIGIKPGLDKSLRHKYGAKLIRKFTDIIVDLGRTGVIIDHMSSVGASIRGVRLLQHFGFTEVLFERADTQLFIMNMEKSGAHIIEAYRKALEESKVA